LVYPAEYAGKMQETEEEEKTATFPAQALSCSGSTGIISALPSRLRRGWVSTPGTLENRFSAGNTKIGNLITGCTSYKKNRVQHPGLFIVFPYTFNYKSQHMKKIIFASFALLIMLSGFSQSDDGNKQTRQVSGFHAIDVSGGIDLYLSNGPESVAISASSNSVRDHIKTEVEDGTLHIFMEKNWSRGIGSGHMKAYVSLPELKSLEASGGSDVFLQNQITAGDLQIRLSGGSDLKGKLNANHLAITQSGGSDVNLSGNVQNLQVEASGGSDLNGFDLVTDYASLNASGGSESHLTVNKELKIVASGGSDVTYKGAATVREIKSSGSSSVTRKD
jgi:hypothetical protein